MDGELLVVVQKHVCQEALISSEEDTGTANGRQEHGVTENNGRWG
jgi:hypothetical protein